MKNANEIAIATHADNLAAVRSRFLLACKTMASPKETLPNVFKSSRIDCVEQILAEPLLRLSVRLGDEFRVRILPAFGLVSQFRAFRLQQRQNRHLVSDEREIHVEDGLVKREKIDERLGIEQMRIGADFCVMIVNVVDEEFSREPPTHLRLPSTQCQMSST